MTPPADPRTVLRALVEAIDNRRAGHGMVGNAADLAFAAIDARPALAAALVMLDEAKDIQVWRQAHELLNAAGIEGEPGLLARIEALIADRDRRAARAIADAIIAELRDRRGLKHEWDAIDEGIREEIAAAWADVAEPIVTAARAEGAATAIEAAVLALSPATSLPETDQHRMWRTAAQASIRALAPAGLVAVSVEALRVMCDAGQDFVDYYESTTMQPATNTRDALKTIRAAVARKGE